MKENSETLKRSSSMKRRKAPSGKVELMKNEN